jgi:hypothetical protein
MPLNPHNYLSALDPRGPADRRWECQYCGDTGTYEELLTRACSYPYPPCESCGQTPECARDCGSEKPTREENLMPIRSYIRDTSNIFLRGAVAGGAVVGLLAWAIWAWT